MNEMRKLMEAIAAIEAAGQTPKHGVEQSEVRVEIDDITLWNDLSTGHVSIQQGQGRVTIEAELIEDVISALQQSLDEYSSTRKKSQSQNSMPFGDPLANFPSIR